MEALPYVAGGFLIRFFFFAVQVRYKAESAKAKQRSNEFKPPAFNLM